MGSTRSERPAGDRDVSDALLMKQVQFHLLRTTPRDIKGFPQLVLVAATLAVGLGLVEVFYRPLTIFHELGHAWAAEAVGHNVTQFQVDFLDQTQGVRDKLGDAFQDGIDYVAGTEDNAMSLPPPPPLALDADGDPTVMAESKIEDYRKDGRLGFVSYAAVLIFAKGDYFDSLDDYNSYAVERNVKRNATDFPTFPDVASMLATATLDDPYMVVLNITNHVEIYASVAEATGKLEIRAEEWHDTSNRLGLAMGYQGTQVFRALAGPFVDVCITSLLAFVAAIALGISWKSVGAFFGVLAFMIMFTKIDYPIICAFQGVDGDYSSAAYTLQDLQGWDAQFLMVSWVFGFAFVPATAFLVTYWVLRGWRQRRVRLRHVVLVLCATAWLEQAFPAARGRTRRKAKHDAVKASDLVRGALAKGRELCAKRIPRKLSKAFASLLSSVACQGTLALVSTSTRAEEMRYLESVTSAPAIMEQVNALFHEQRGLYSRLLRRYYDYVKGVLKGTVITAKYLRKIRRVLHQEVLHPSPKYVRRVRKYCDLICKSSIEDVERLPGLWQGLRAALARDHTFMPFQAFMDAGQADPHSWAIIAFNIRTMLSIGTMHARMLSGPIFVWWPFIHIVFSIAVFASQLCRLAGDRDIPYISTVNGPCMDLTDTITGCLILLNIVPISLSVWRFISLRVSAVDAPPLTRSFGKETIKTRVIPAAPIVESHPDTGHMRITFSAHSPNSGGTFERLSDRNRHGSTSSSSSSSSGSLDSIDSHQRFAPSDDEEALEGAFRGSSMQPRPVMESGPSRSARYERRPVWPMSEVADDEAQQSAQGSASGARVHFRHHLRDLSSHSHSHDPSGTVGTVSTVSLSQHLANTSRHELSDATSVEESPRGGRGGFGSRSVASASSARTSTRNAMQQSVLAGPTSLAWSSQMGGSLHADESVSRSRIVSLPTSDLTALLHLPTQELATSVGAESPSHTVGGGSRKSVDTRNAPASPAITPAPSGIVSMPGVPTAISSQVVASPIGGAADSDMLRATLSDAGTRSDFDELPTDVDADADTDTDADADVDVDAEQGEGVNASISVFNPSDGGRHLETQQFEEAQLCTVTEPELLKSERPTAVSIAGNMKRNSATIKRDSATIKRDSAMSTISDKIGTKSLRIADLKPTGSPWSPAVTDEMAAMRGWLRALQGSYPRPLRVAIRSTFRVMLLWVLTNLCCIAMCAYSTLRFEALVQFQAASATVIFTCLSSAYLLFWHGGIVRSTMDMHIAAMHAQDWKWRCTLAKEVAALNFKRKRGKMTVSEASRWKDLKGSKLLKRVVWWHESMHVAAALGFLTPEKLVLLDEADAAGKHPDRVPLDHEFLPEGLLPTSELACSSPLAVPPLPHASESILSSSVERSTESDVSEGEVDESDDEDIAELAAMGQKEAETSRMFDQSFSAIQSFNVRGKASSKRKTFAAIKDLIDREMEAGGDLVMAMRETLRGSMSGKRPSEGTPSFKSAV